MEVMYEVEVRKQGIQQQVVVVVVVVLVRSGPAQDQRASHRKSTANGINSSPRQKLV